MSINAFYCDTLELDVELLNEDHTPFEMDDADQLWFAIKSKYSDPVENIFIQQHDTHFKINLPETLRPGVYMYEVGIIFSDGTERTLIPNACDYPASFIICDRLKGISDERY